MAPLALTDKWKVRRGFAPYEKIIQGNGNTFRTYRLPWSSGTLPQHSSIQLGLRLPDYVTKHMILILSKVG
jgi:hypothetical protein